MSGYNMLERPVRVEKNPLVVVFSIVIQQIIDVVGFCHFLVSHEYHYTFVWQYDRLNVIKSAYRL